MGTSVDIYCLRDRDEEFETMKTIAEACLKQKIKWPAQVDKYFEGSTDYEAALEIQVASGIEEVDDDNYQIWDIDLSKLPQGAKRIRVKWG